MYKHILVAVDGSDTSQRALREAINFAKDYQAELRLVHVIDETPLVWGESAALGVTETVFEALRQIGQATANKSLAVVHQAGLKAEVILSETCGQRIANIIVEEANRWPADMIVIGSHGRRGVDRLLLGSVAEGVVRLTSRPVLLVRGV
ncbi:MAG: universal stress protein [Sulfuricaulis sp.]